MKWVALAGNASLWGIAAALGGEFVNLTFDEPDWSHLGQYPFDSRLAYGAVSEVLRGWTVEYESEGPIVGFDPDYATVGSGGFALGLVYAGPGAMTPPYYVFANDIAVSRELGGSLRPAVHLFQVGLIPEDAGELRFYLSWNEIGGPLPVFINGQRQGYYNVTPVWRAIDVKRFAGQEVKLEFLFPEGNGQWFRLDVIGFQAIDEPSVFGLVGVGSGVVWWTARRRRRG